MMAFAGMLIHIVICNCTPSTWLVYNRSRRWKVIRGIVTNIRKIRSEPPPGAFVAMSSTGSLGFHSCAIAGTVNIARLHPTANNLHAGIIVSRLERRGDELLIVTTGLLRLANSSVNSGDVAVQIPCFKLC